MKVLTGTAKNVIPNKTHSDIECVVLSRRDIFFNLL